MKTPPAPSRLKKGRLPLGASGTIFRFRRPQVVETKLGEGFRAAIFPGEVLPEMVIGGRAMTKELFWDGTDFAYPSMRKMVRRDRLFGLCNDMLGYILPDNDYAMVFLLEERQNSNQELITFGRSMGSTLMGAFQALIGKVKG